MKKLLFIVLSLLLLYGCSDYNTYSSWIDEVDVIRRGEVLNDIYIRKFTYEGHKYLKFDSHCVIHDPNCECFNKDRI